MRRLSAWLRQTATPEQLAALLAEHAGVGEPFAWLDGSPRAAQTPPAGPWGVWFVNAGRGFGKTRTGAEWVAWLVRTGRARRVALVGATAADARDVMVEGESGLLGLAWSAGGRPTYEPSKRRLTWPNGAIATTYSADEPNRLRGPQHDAAWCDEIAAWRYPETWDMLQLGLRLGDDPRVIVTTTPRPTPLVRALIADEHTAITGGSTHENAANLAAPFLATITRRYAGTRLGRQELEAELLTDTPGALWTLASIDALRVREAPAMVRVVVGVDPKTGGGAEEGGETGIIVDGKGADGHGYTLADYSTDGGPEAWAPRVLRAYREHRADAIVVEKNQGGAMVAHTIRNTPGGANVPIIEVWASRGKVTRAEPIAVLYAPRGHWHHVGAFPELESQMTTYVPGETSPDRMDAHVWAASELFPQEDSDASFAVSPLSAYRG